MASHLPRERQICHINDVVPRRPNWKVLIQVLEKKKSGTSRSILNPTEYRGYLFTDTMGTLVSAVCYAGDVAYFEASLQPYKRYYISNAYVKPVRAGYEAGDYGFSWTLYNTTSIQPLAEDIPPPIPYDFQFRHFSDLIHYADRETPINIKAFVVQAWPEKKVGVDMYHQDLMAQDFVVVETNKTPMLMRLWKEKLTEYGDILSQDLPDGVMFVGMNMKVTTFNGLSLSSCLNSVLLKEPVLHEGPAFKDRYVSNKKNVDDMLTRMDYNNTDMLLRKPIAAEITPIADALATFETMKTAWIVGKLKLNPGQDRLWYLACKNCHRALNHNHQMETPCTYCDATELVTVRCHIRVLVTDASGSVYAEIYSPDAEQLIPFSAQLVKEAEEQGLSLIAELESAFENKHVVCFIKYFDRLVRGVVARKFPLVKIYLYTDVFPVEEPVPHQPESITMLSADEGTVDLTKDDKDDVHFFTPSTKVLIEEISTSSQNAVFQGAGQPGCKRVLSFDESQKCTSVVKLEPVDEDGPLQSTHESASIESPVKKTKGKLKMS